MRRRPRRALRSAGRKKEEKKNAFLTDRAPEGHDGRKTRARMGRRANQNFQSGPWRQDAGRLLLIREIDGPASPSRNCGHITSPGACHRRHLWSLSQISFQAKNGGDRRGRPQLLGVSASEMGPATKTALALGNAKYEAADFAGPGPPAAPGDCRNGSGP